MSEKKPFTIRGPHVFGAFVLFFGVIIVVNIIFISMANKTFPGVTTEDPYEKGVRYNETLAHKEAASKLGWSVSQNLYLDDMGHEHFLVRINSEDGPVTGLDVRATLRWGGLPKADQNLILLAVADGVYGAPIKTIDEGKRKISYEGVAVRSADGISMTFAGEL